MSFEQDKARPVGVGELGRAWRVLAVVAMLGTAVLAIGGFVNSFSAVKAAVEPSFGGLAWTIPILVDVGILVFTAVDLVMARMGMRIWWVRFIPLGLIGVTVWLNVAHHLDDPVAVTAHAVAPAIWFIPVEIGALVVRRSNGLNHQAARRAAGRLDRVRLRRWFHAPVETAAMRHRMIVDEERSIDVARARMRSRQDVRWELQDRYGAWAWRWRAPRRVRGRYRRADLDLESLAGLLGPATVTESPARPLVDPGPAGPEPAEAARAALPSRPGNAAGPKRKAPGRSAGRNGARPGSGSGPVGVAELVAPAREVIAELTSSGRSVSRRSLGDALRARGLSASNEKVAALLAQLDEPAGQVSPHGATEPAVSVPEGNGTNEEAERSMSGVGVATAVAVSGGVQ